MKQCLNGNLHWKCILFFLFSSFCRMFLLSFLLKTNCYRLCHIPHSSYAEVPSPKMTMLEITKSLGRWLKLGGLIRVKLSSRQKDECSYTKDLRRPFPQQEGVKSKSHVKGTASRWLSASPKPGFASSLTLTLAALWEWAGAAEATVSVGLCCGALKRLVHWLRNNYLSNISLNI